MDNNTMNYKVYAVNYNGVLDEIIDRLEKNGNYTENYHEADLFLLWQDVRGECMEIARLAKISLRKPVFVMQHGRAATRDYCPPNKFELTADKILVWGEADHQRLLSQGIAGDRIEITGCPLIPRLKPKVKEREGKNVLFVPVISEKEEPENFIVYQKLRIWEAEKAIKRVYRDFEGLKKAWAWEFNELKEVELPDGTKEKRLWKKEVRKNLPRWVTYSDGLVNVKLTGIHDLHQYQSPMIATNQGDPYFIEALIELLANIDVMVCLEEGTMQLLAYALDMPVICVDIFKYNNYGGCKDYDKVEKIKTAACYWTNNIDKIGSMVDHALANPAELRKHRIKVVEHEGGAHLGDTNANVIRTIESYLERNERKEAIAV